MNGKWTASENCEYGQTKSIVRREKVIVNHFGQSWQQIRFTVRFWWKVNTRRCETLPQSESGLEPAFVDFVKRLSAKSELKNGRSSRLKKKVKSAAAVPSHSRRPQGDLSSQSEHRSSKSIGHCTPIDRWPFGSLENWESGTVGLVNERALRIASELQKV